VKTGAGKHALRVMALGLALGLLLYLGYLATGLLS